MGESLSNRNKKRLLKAWLLVAMLLAPILASVDVAAQEANQQVVMAPFSTSIEGIAGEEVSRSFQLSNYLDYEIKVELEIAEFVEIGNGDTKLVQDPIQLNAASWIELPRRSMTIQPNSSKEVKFSITAPADTAADHYFPAIIAKWDMLDSSAGESTEETKLTPSIAHRIDINIISSASLIQLDILKLSAPQVVFTSNFDIDYLFKNSSRGYTNPIGYLQVVDPYGQPVWKVIINDSLDILKKDGTIEGAKTYEREDGKLIPDPGQYTVELLVIDSNTRASQLSKITLLIIPWQLILSVIILLLVIVVGGVTLKRRKDENQLITNSI